MSKRALKLVNKFLSEKIPLGHKDMAEANAEEVYELYEVIRELIKAKYELGVYESLPIKVHLTNAGTHNQIVCDVPYPSEVQTEKDVFGEIRLALSRGGRQ